MRNRFIILLIAIFYGGINYYIGLRGWQWLGAVAPERISAWVWWGVFWLISLAFLIARVGGERLPRPLTGALARVGAYWMLVLLYVLPVLLAVDLVRLLAHGLGWAIGWRIAVSQAAVATFGGAVLLLLVTAVLYGVWRARHPVISRYEITIPKSGGRYRDLHLVLVSDTHLGAINGRKRLDRLIAMVDSLAPDVLLLAGDITDDEFRPFATPEIQEGLKRLKAKLGVYSVLGNHEYIAGHLDEYRSLMAQAGITVLVDRWLKVDDSFYVIGRDDIAGRRFAGQPRKPLAELLEGVDRALPLILMDHQPYRLEEAEQAGVDLQLSGHTHRGQMFPNHLITSRIFELDWGYRRKGALHVIVSLGFGTWGPPVRIGNRPEVVSIRVRFAGGQA